MRDAGCTQVIMEVSSHSLVLDRVHGIRFAVGAFTNLTQDHLDFHKTMEAYRQAKAILFTISDKGVINLDDPAAKAMLADAKCPCMTFSCDKDAADLTAKNIALHADGVSFVATTRDELARVKLPIPGHFSVENALTALGIVLQLGLPLADAARSLATATGVKGPRGGRTDRYGLHRADRLRPLAGRRGKRAARGARLCQGQRSSRCLAAAATVTAPSGPRWAKSQPILRISASSRATTRAPRTPQAIIDDILEGMKDSKNAHAGDRRPGPRPSTGRWLMRKRTISSC